MSVQDPARPQQAFRISAQDEDCLASSLPVIQNYFSGQAAANQVDEAWDCTTEIVDMFSKFSRGNSEPSSYTATELRYFLQENYMGSLQISDELLTEIMRLKQTVLGGSIDRVTRDELKQVKEIIQVLKGESIRVLPYVRILTQDLAIEDVRGNPAFFDKGMEEFVRAAEAISLHLGKSGQAYELDYFKNLLNGIQSLYADSSKWKGPTRFASYLPALAAVKALLIRPDGSKIQPQEWQGFLVKAAKLYSLLLRNHYLMEPSDLLYGEGLRQLKIAIDQGFEIVDEALKSRPDHTIDYELIHPVVDEAFRLNLVEWSLRPSSVHGVIEVLLGRVLNPPDGAADSASGKLVRPPVRGLTAENFARGREMLLGWLDMQRLWTELQTRAVEKDPSLRGKAIPLPVVQSIWKTLKSPYRDSYSDLSHLLLNRRFPVVYTQDGTIVFERNPKLLAFDQAGFDSFNWKAKFVRALLLGYAENPVQNRKLGLTKEEFKQLFFGLRALAVDLKYVDPSDEEIWSSTFDEANIFMLSDELGERLSYSEGFDLISFALSSSKMSRRVMKDLKENCQQFENDVFGIPKVTAECYRRRLGQTFVDAYDYLPAWSKLARGLKADEFVQFERLLEVAARRSGYSDKLIESTDVDRTSMMLQYLESLYVRYDADKSGTINLAEAELIYPRFKSMLSDVSGYSDDETLLAIFIYVLKYREAPEGLWNKIWFKFVWMRDKSRWQIDVSRLHLLEIVGQLNSISAASAK